MKPKIRMLALHGNVLVAFTGPPASESVSDGVGKGKKENPKHTGCRRLKPQFCSLGSDRTQTQGSGADGQGGNDCAEREEEARGEARGEELISVLWRNSPLGGVVHVSLKTKRRAGTVRGAHKESLHKP